jgi:hypothetical protein
VKLTVILLLQNYPTFYGTRRYITVFTRSLQWSLSCAKSIQSLLTNYSSPRSILILSTHLYLGFPSVLFPSDISSISYMHSFSPQFMQHSLPISYSSAPWFQTPSPLFLPEYQRQSFTPMKSHRQNYDLVYSDFYIFRQ